MTNDSLRADGGLKQQVMAALEQDWPRFAVEHPSLAQVLDRAVLAVWVTDSLADDPAFTEAYRGAVEAGVAAEAVLGLVRTFTRVALARLG